jgi:hypothetical protein
MISDKELMERFFELAFKKDNIKAWLNDILASQLWVIDRDVSDWEGQSRRAYLESYIPILEGLIKDYFDSL